MNEQGIKFDLLNPVPKKEPEGRDKKEMALAQFLGEFYIPNAKVPDEDCQYKYGNSVYYVCYKLEAEELAADYLMQHPIEIESYLIASYLNCAALLPCIEALQKNRKLLREEARYSEEIKELFETFNKDLDTLCWEIVTQQKENWALFLSCDKTEHIVTLKYVSESIAAESFYIYRVR